MERSILDQLERAERRWTIDDMGHHVQCGDLLDVAEEELAERSGLFTLKEISDLLMEKLDPVLLKSNGDEDKKSVLVADVRGALSEAGL